jgi:hypothetical protein
MRFEQSLQMQLEQLHAPKLKSEGRLKRTIACPIITIYSDRAIPPSEGLSR